jgi:hypothetical protein
VTLQKRRKSEASGRHAEPAAAGDQKNQEMMMTEEHEEGKKKVKINLQNLYMEEAFTDLKVANIRRLTPVKPNGEPDKTRPVLFVGQTQLVTPHGPVPISFPIEAKNLQLAIEQFPDVMEQFVEKIMAEAREMQRQEQSRIIVPDAGLNESNLILK